MFSIFVMDTKFKITDDSGFLAIANPETYNSFVGEDWDLPHLMSRFIDEMNKDALIIWSTGSSGEWTVLFADKPTNKRSFREFEKTITVTEEKLCLTNYEDLTMAAQFENDKIPAKHNSDLLIKLENGQYKFTVRQMFDPDDFDYDSGRDVNFEIILQSINDIKIQKADKVFWMTE